MLPKTQRLTSEDFKDFRGGKTTHSPHFIFRSKAGAAPARIAAVVSSSVAKLAVDRNLLRRRVYEALAKHGTGTLPSLLSITAKKGAPKLSYGEIEEELREGLKKL